MMTEEIHIEQNSEKSKENMNIGIQNNYNGLTPIEACKLATNLFYDNFPKLQEYAKEIIETKMKEFMDSVADKLQNKGVTNMSPLGDPDIQYILYEVQKNYARLGTQDMLNTLSDLIAYRIQHNQENISLKVSIDKSIEIATMLNSRQLDLLSLIFLTNHVKLSDINNIDELKEHLESISKIFSDADFNSYFYLNMLGCLQLHLHDTCVTIANSYNLNVEEVKKVCPDIVLKTTGDYITSYVGTILAIINIEQKTHYKYKFNPAKWVK